MTEEAPKSRIRRLSDYISPVWFVPLIAILIGLWMVIHSFSERGPMITLNAENADGIKSGTKITARNVQLGEVQSIELSQDASHAVLKARMSPDAERVLGKDTKFWVVKPRIGRDGISGLNTVLSGAYIEMLPDTHGDGTGRTYSILDQPPIASTDAGGLSIHLDSDNGNYLSEGDPVIFQGFTVGRVQAAHFDTKERKVHYDLYIYKEYASTVTTNTHFWVTSGVNFGVNAEGLNLKLGSLETLLSGGVTFGVNNGVDPGKQVKPDTHFQLFPDQDEAEQNSFNQYKEYVLLLDDSIWGLTPGAPVQYRGVRVGTVVAMPWHINKLAANNLDNFRIPVLIRIEPQRLQPVVTDKDMQHWTKLLDDWQKRGMRASLASANMFTGALVINLTFADQAEAEKSKPAVKTFEGVPVFPSMKGGSYSEITTRIATLLDKVNDLDFQSTMSGVNKTLNNSGELLQRLDATTQGINELLKDPETRKMPADARNTLKQVNKTLQGFNPQSQAYGELQGTIKQLQQLLRNMQPAVRSISAKPNALIFNRSGNGDPQPRAHQ